MADSILSHFQLVAMMTYGDDADHEAWVLERQEWPWRRPNAFDGRDGYYFMRAVKHTEAVADV